MRRRPVRLLLVVAAVAAVAAGGVSALGVTSKNRGLVAILSVLRRPQTKADLGLGPPQTYAILAHPPQDRTPVKSLIRLAATVPGGGKVFLVPMRPAGQGDSNTNLTLAVFGAGGGSCCTTAAAIEAHGSWISGGPPEQLVVVVPNGVAKVAALIRRPPAFKRSEAVRATVHNNVAVFILRHPIDSPGGFIWYGSSGAAIKRIR
jgi:hypothetical protein